MTIFTFHLREGLKWSDGTSLTAKDYVYSVLRVLAPETISQYVNMISDYVVNGQEYYNGTVSAEEVGIKTVNDNTLEFTLNAPCAYFVDLVSMWGTTKAKIYICNDPFKITQMNMGESMILEKINPRYILDVSTALTAYENC